MKTIKEVKDEMLDAYEAWATSTQIEEILLSFANEVKEECAKVCEAKIKLLEDSVQKKISKQLADKIRGIEIK